MKENWDYSPAKSRVCVYVRMCVYVCVRMCVYVCIHVVLYIYIYTCVCVHVYMCACVYMCQLLDGNIGAKKVVASCCSRFKQGYPYFKGPLPIPATAPVLECHALAEFARHQQWKSCKASAPNKCPNNFCMGGGLFANLHASQRCHGQP